MHAHTVIQTLLLREAHPALPPVLPVTDGVLLKSAPSLHAFRFNLCWSLPAEFAENAAIVRPRAFLPCQHTQWMMFHKVPAVGRTKSR